MSAHRTVEVASGNALFKACPAHLVSTGVHNGLGDELKTHRAVGSVREATAVWHPTPYKLKIQKW